MRPSCQPIAHPTMQPSRQPTSRPTMKPSRQPTSHPTQPTSQPTSQPTTLPSKVFVLSPVSPGFQTGAVQLVVQQVGFHPHSNTHTRPIGRWIGSCF